MNRKVVREAVSYQMPRDGGEQVARALSLIIARDGVLRTDERHLKWTLEPLVAAGVLRNQVNGNTHTFSLGDDFEKFLMDWVDTAGRSDYYKLIKEYREYLVRTADKYLVNSSDVFDNFTNLLSSEDKFVYLASVLGEVSEKLDSALERITELEAKLNELDFALAVVEHADSDADSDS